MNSKTSLLDRITQNPGLCGGRPCIRGMRIRVNDILEMLAENVSPQILWLTCGNVTNRKLRRLLIATLPDALERLRQGETIVEMGN